MPAKASPLRSLTLPYMAAVASCMATSRWFGFEAVPGRDGVVVPGGTRTTSRVSGWRPAPEKATSYVPGTGSPVNW